ncbi:MAG: hypothetical protein WCF61_11730 [Terriglobales bacterium]
MSDTTKAIKVIQLSNGIPFHSWVIGLPYFSIERLAGNDEEAEAEELKPSIN